MMQNLIVATDGGTWRGILLQAEGWAHGLNTDSEVIPFRAMASLSIT